VIPEGFTLLVFMVASGVLNFLEEDFSLRKSTTLVSSLNVRNIINAFFYEGFFFISVDSLYSHGEGQWAPKGSVSYGLSFGRGQSYVFLLVFVGLF